MGLFESGKSRRPALALIAGACLASLCATAPSAQQTPPAPPPPQPPQQQQTQPQPAQQPPAAPQPAPPQPPAPPAPASLPAQPPMPTPPPPPSTPPATEPPLQTLAPVEAPPPLQPLPWSTKPPPVGQEWRTLRRIDLPAQLVRAYWDDESYVGPNRPMLMGRTAITLPVGPDRTAVVRSAKNAPEGIVIDNLNCTNSVRGERRCTILLDPPDSCYLFVFGEIEKPAAKGDGKGEVKIEPTPDLRAQNKADNLSYRIDCPTRLLLGR